MLLAHLNVYHIIIGIFKKIKTNLEDEAFRSLSEKGHLFIVTNADILDIQNDQ